jgi:hypothetical protein
MTATHHGLTKLPCILSKQVRLLLFAKNHYVPNNTVASLDVIAVRKHPAS